MSELGTATWNTDPNYTSQSQSGSSYPLNLDAAVKVGKRSANMFAPHEQNVGSPAPDLTVRIEGGAIWNNGTLTEVAAQTVSGFTVPTAGQNRTDRVVMDPTTGVCTRVAGTAATGSPSSVAPAITEGCVPICQVYITSADTAITNNMITDERQTFSSAMNIERTAVALSAQTSIDFTSIPPGVTEIDVTFDVISTNGTSEIIVQIGDSAGGLQTAGYSGAGDDRTASAFPTNGFPANRVSVAARVYSGVLLLRRISSTKWASIAILGPEASSGVQFCGSSKTLSTGPLDRVRITTVAGTDAFDSGTIGLRYRR